MKPQVWATRLNNYQVHVNPYLTHPLAGKDLADFIVGHVSAAPPAKVAAVVAPTSLTLVDPHAPPPCSVWHAISGWHHTMRVCQLCDGAYCCKCRRGDWIQQPCVSAPCTMEEP